MITSAFLVFMALLSLVFRIYTYSEPLERDLTHYAIMGHELLKGRLFYSDLWDIKSPIISGVYACAELVVGYGVQQILFLNVLVSWISLLGIFYSAYLISRLLFEEKQVSARPNWICFLATFFWVLFGLSYSIQSNQPNSEVFINASVIWGFALLLRGSQESGKKRIASLCLASLFFGIGTLFKQVILCTAFLLAAAHYVIVLTEKKKKLSSRLEKGLIESSIIVAGIPLLWTMMSVYFAITDRWSIYVKSTFDYVFYYSGSTINNILNGIKISTLMPYFFWFSIPFFVVIFLGTFIVFFQCIYTPKRVCQFEKQCSWRIWLYLSSLGFGSFLAICLPGKFFPHYYQLWLPYLCLGATLGIFEIKKSASALIPGKKNILEWIVFASIMFSISIFFIELIGEPWIGISPDEISKKKYGGTFVYVRNMGEEIKRKTAPNARLYQWGIDPGIYFYANRDPVPGVLWANLIKYGPLGEEFTQRTLLQIKSEPPDYIVIDMLWFLRPSDNVITKWIIDNYRPDPSFAMQGFFRVYVKKPIG